MQTQDVRCTSLLLFVHITRGMYSATIPLFLKNTVLDFFPNDQLQGTIIYKHRSYNKN